MSERAIDRTAERHRVAQLVKRHWGWTADIVRLNGEYDDNYQVSGANGRHILKLMRRDCDPTLVEMQIATLNHYHAGQRSPDDPTLPRLVPASDGQLLLTVDADGPRIAWMMSFLPGEVMAGRMPISPPTARSIGAGLARLDRGLVGFQHPGLHRKLDWDLRQAGWISASIDLHAEPRRTLIATIEHDHDRRLKDALALLPTAVIHNDANEMNLLVDGEDTPFLSGIIDFGDMTKSARIGEAAVAATYAMMGADDPLAIAGAIIAGYHAGWPLTEAEIELFLPLVQLRLAVSVTTAARNRMIFPDTDPYLLISEAPAWAMLEWFGAIDIAAAAASMHALCQAVDKDCANG